MSEFEVAKFRPAVKYKVAKYRPCCTVIGLSLTIISRKWKESLCFSKPNKSISAFQALPRELAGALDGTHRNDRGACFSYSRLLEHFQIQPGFQRPSEGLPTSASPPDLQVTVTRGSAGETDDWTQEKLGGELQHQVSKVDDHDLKVTSNSPCIVCFLEKWPQTKCKVTFDTCFWPSFSCSFTW